MNKKTINAFIKGKKFFLIGLLISVCSSLIWHYRTQLSECFAIPIGAISSIASVIASRIINSLRFNPSFDIFSEFVGYTLSIIFYGFVGWLLDILERKNSKALKVLLTLIILVLIVYMSLVYYVLCIAKLQFF